MLLKHSIQALGYLDGTPWTFLLPFLLNSDNDYFHEMVAIIRTKDLPYKANTSDTDVPFLDLISISNERNSVKRTCKTKRDDVDSK